MGGAERQVKVRRCSLGRNMTGRNIKKKMKGDELKRGAEGSG